VKTNCPECDAAFRAKPGSTVPCPKCGNPVVVKQADAQHAGEAAKQPAKHTSSKPVEAPDTAPHPQLPWVMVAVVLAVLAVAHYGLYLLITATARAEIEEYEGRHGAVALRSAKDPGKAPIAGSEAFVEWSGKRELWTESIKHDDAGKERTLVSTGLFLAYLLQVAFMGWALYSMNAKHKRASRRRR